MTSKITDDSNPPPIPGTLQEFLWYVKRYETGIFFRVQRNGKWVNASVAELTPREFGEKIGRMIEDGRVPVRIKEEWEVDNVET